MPVRVVQLSVPVAMSMHMPVSVSVAVVHAALLDLDAVHALEERHVSAMEAK